MNRFLLHSTLVGHDDHFMGSRGESTSPPHPATTRTKLTDEKINCLICQGWQGIAQHLAEADACDGPYREACALWAIFVRSAGPERVALAPPSMARNCD